MKNKLFAITMLFTGMYLNSVNAQCGYALKFVPGDGCHVYSDGYLMADVTNNFTMEFWIKPGKSIKTGMTESNTGFEGLSDQNYVVFPGEHTVANDACGLAVSVGTNGVAVLEGADGTGGRLATTLVHYTSISSTDWTHIAIVCLNKTPLLYINGVYAKTGLTSTASFVHPSAILGDVSSYGGYGYGPFNWGPTDAIIDEFRIWSVALSASTIINWHDKYITSSHPDYSNLHTFWNFGEGSGDVTADVTGNGNTGLFVYTYPPIWVAGWAPAGVTVSAGADENTYFGYAADQCVSKTASISGGTGPFTYSWSLDRALLPGETMTGASTSSVTVCLMDTALLCISITDACGFTFTDCANIFAEDVRCGNGNNQKTTICHNGNTICVDNSAVPAHLDHGDYVGACAETMGRPRDNTEQVSTVGMNIFPNPGKGDITVSFSKPGFSDGNTILQIINSNGQIVKTINTGNQNRVQFRMDVPGVYIARMTNGKEMMQKKFVVIK